MQSREDAEGQEGFVRGFHDIPDAEKLNAMSFSELASELSSSEKDSPKFLVIERELKRHLAKDQAAINRPNMLWAAGIGGGFALAGVVLGAYLNNFPAFKQIPPPSAVQQLEKVDLAIRPPKGSIAPSTPPVAVPAVKPAAVQSNGQNRKSAP